ncbi:hypothetical protein QE152_g13562 [Popillia japonica]|uniref:Uncharacterized protein n=1 Tax=Popillia japonica TaxID=7064 RepID=A0AAW1LBI2_POPJA
MLVVNPQKKALAHTEDEFHDFQEQTQEKGVINLAKMVGQMVENQKRDPILDNLLGKLTLENCTLSTTPHHTLLAVFNPLKSGYNQACYSFLKSNEDCRITKLNFGKLLHDAWGKTGPVQNAASGFKATAVIPDDAVTKQPDGELSQRINKKMEMKLLSCGSVLQLVVSIVFLRRFL